MAFISVISLRIDATDTHDVALSSKNSAIKFFATCFPEQKISSSDIVMLEKTGDAVRVFNKVDGGWVMLIRSLGQWNVIAYSEDGLFDVSGESVPGLFDSVFSAFEQLSVRTNVKSVSFDKMPVAKKGPLLTTHWGQGYPFNKFCPYDVISKKHTLAGCINVAMAQLFNYYKKPDYTPFHKIQWELMRDDYKNGEYSDEEANAVATLFSDIAQTTTTYYSTNETGGRFPSEYPAYTAVNSYSREELREYITNSDEPQLLVIGWTEKTGKSTKHAVIVDGVDSNGFWHINWGWNGMCDGWYNPDNFILKNSEGEFSVRLGDPFDEQRLLHYDPQYYMPGMITRGGISVDKPAAREGEWITVTFNDVGYIDSQYLDFNEHFKRQLFDIEMHYEFPYTCEEYVKRYEDYKPGYVGMDYCPPDSRYTLICLEEKGSCVKYEGKIDGVNVNLSFHLPIIPEGKTIIFKPYYRFEWCYNEYIMQNADGTTGKITTDLSSGNAYENYFRASPESGSSDCLLVRKHENGLVSFEPALLANLIYDNVIEENSGVENIVVERSLISNEIVGYYNLSGQMRLTPWPGINIVVYADRHTSKMIY